MIIVCSTENKDKCRLASSLNHRKLELENLESLSVDCLKMIHTNFERTSDNIPPCFDPSCFNIRLVTSKQAGNGKSLWIKRKIKEIKSNLKNLKTFCYRFHELEANKTKLIDFFSNCEKETGENNPILFHLDITNVYQLNLDDVLFSLIILRCIIDKKGKVWARNPNHYFLIECSNFGLERLKSLQLLPKIVCLSPIETLEEYFSGSSAEGITYIIILAINLIKLFMLLLSLSIFFFSTANSEKQLMIKDEENQKIWNKCCAYLKNQNTIKTVLKNYPNYSPRECLQVLLE